MSRSIQQPALDDHLMLAHLSFSVLLLICFSNKAVAGTSMLAAPIQGELVTTEPFPKVGQKVYLKFIGRASLSDVPLKLILIQGDCFEIVEGLSSTTIEKTIKNKPLTIAARIKILTAAPCTVAVQIISHELGPSRQGSIFGLTFNRSKSRETDNQIKGKDKSGQPTIEVEVGKS